MGSKSNFPNYSYNDSLFYSSGASKQFEKPYRPSEPSNKPSKPRAEPPKSNDLHYTDSVYIQSHKTNFHPINSKLILASESVFATQLKAIDCWINPDLSKLSTDLDPPDYSELPMDKI